jgi:flagellar motor switch protein FliG
MALTGKQKAAMLLMSLDSISAAELLKGVKPELVQELAVELAYLDAAGYSNSNERLEVVRNFCDSLQAGDSKFQIKNFLKEMLKSTMGEEKAEHIQTQIQDLLKKRDPFMAIRSADPKLLASLLETEHPRAIAIVLSELDPKKSSEVISLLKEDIRLSAVSRMAGSEAVNSEAKIRIAEIICERIEELTSASEGAAVHITPDQSLRKVAIILRNLAKELRDGLLIAIQQKDSQAGEKISSLMILWEDIPLVADRPLQQALRGLDSRKLALALTNVDDTINKKIRANISERASAALDEEKSLMSAPRKEEIEQARQEFVDVLRKMNQSGELSFIET